MHLTDNRAGLICFVGKDAERCQNFKLHNTVVFAFLLAERFQVVQSLVSGLVSENVGQIGGCIGK